MDVKKVIERAERDCAPVFSRLDEIERRHTERILDAFAEFSVAARHFASTTGYGYDDVGRDTLEKIYARLFGAEEAIVRPHLTGGTHTLAVCLFGLLRPGEHLLSAAGKPYDTMQSVIGFAAEDKTGTLEEMGVEYSDVELKNGLPDVDGVLQALRPNTRVVMLQRSRGYAWRRALTPEDMEPLMTAVHRARPDIFIMVDNCYGEFTGCTEPSMLGADVIAGSLIKNPGGGLAPTGGYIAGTACAVHRIEARLTAPGIGRETGSYEGGYRPFYQGLFMAPHTVNQALKTAALAARTAELLGMRSSPAFDAPRSDIIQALEMGGRERLIAFCRGIQSASPVDSFAAPEPWAMPGYQDEVIMAAGTFVSGASVELSADAPMRPPFIVYMQGGLTYAHGRTAITRTFEQMAGDGLLSAVFPLSGRMGLHMHSTCSDGTDTPEALAEKAAAAGLAFAALTDHDTLSGQRRFLAACESRGVRAVTGVELDALFEGRDAHILAYGCDADDPVFASFVERSGWLLREMSVLLVGRLHEAGFPVSLDDFEKYTTGKTGYFKALHYLMDRGAARTPGEVFALYEKFGVRYKKMPFPTAREAVEAIHRAGGRAVVAHPGKTFEGMEENDVAAAAGRLCALGMDGVECWYPGHSRALEEKLCALCDRMGLIKTAGSDCHGAAGSARVDDAAHDIAGTGAELLFG